MTETREKTVCRLPELKERHLPGDCREAVYTLLKETYGYEQFRDLEVYDDLFKGKDTLQISQGQLIESVIVEAEKARNGGEDVITSCLSTYRCGKILVVPVACHLSG